jgi:xeroderma pigmentosum group C-complementing protein
LERPVKQVKAKKKPVAKGFQALSSYGVSEEAQEGVISAMENQNGEAPLDDLYGVWQTEPWSPPRVGPGDAIPTNAHRNVELALLNPGLTHLPAPRLSVVARRLGVPYAPCLVGYEGRRGGCAPSIRGVVVHAHNAALLREAYAEWEGHAAEQEREERRRQIRKKWKRLVAGIMTKDRLDREYG